MKLAITYDSVYCNSDTQLSKTQTTQFHLRKSRGFLKTKTATTAGQVPFIHVYDSTLRIQDDMQVCK